MQHENNLTRKNSYKKNNYCKFEHIRNYLSQKKLDSKLVKDSNINENIKILQRKFSSSLLEEDKYFSIYEDILRKNTGILEVSLKFPVRDLFALSLVYTPGVAAPCLDIQKDISKSYAYTNRLNTMLIITDCSRFEKDELWNDSAAMPFLEAFCVYYKELANIDCYPLIFDSRQIKTTEEFVKTVYAVSSSFSAVEFFGVNETNVNTFRKIYNSKSPIENTFLWIDTSDRKSLCYKYKMDITFVYAAILRVLLDSQIYIDANTIIQKILSNFFKNENEKKNFENINLYKKTNLILREVIDDVFEKLNFIEFFSKDEKYIESDTDSILGFKYVKYFSYNKPEHNINSMELTNNYIQSKYEKFLLEGDQAWVNVLPNHYSPEKNTNDINALILHWRYKGVIKTNTKIKFRDIDLLEKLFCFPNIERVSEIIKYNPQEAYNLTCKSNLGAIITNGTAILGLGDIGALAGMPVMEGKSVLFKLYGGTDIIPICIQEKNEDKLISLIKRIGNGLSIINLEDVRAPQCFKIERTLNQHFDYPVFHDDQHGTAVVVLAGLINAIKLKKVEDKSKIKIVMNGAGAAGLSVTELLISYGFTNFIICDTEGAIYKGRPGNMNEFKNKLSDMTNLNCEKGKLSDIIKNADAFIGLSVAGALTKEMIKSMASQPIIFALANPKPEIYPNEALEAGAFIVATGRSDFANQINNSLAFPGIFRAAIDTRVKNITTEMKVAAAIGIATLIDDNELRPDNIMPGSLDTGVSIAVTKAVAETAIKSGENRKSDVTLEQVEENIYAWFLEGKLINPEYIKVINLKF